MLTFIIPLLLGSIIGFLIRGKPSESFVISGKKRAAWAIGVGLVGVVAGLPIGLAISPSTGSSIAGLIGAGLGIGVFYVLSLESSPYKKWSEKKTLVWLIGAVLVLFLILLSTSKENPSVADSALKEDQPKESANNNTVEFTSVPKNYLGVSLGATEMEVRYVLGEPTERIETDQTRILVFDQDRMPSRMIWLKNDRAILVMCLSQCPPLLGVDIGDSEQAVKTKLGRVQSESFVNTEPTIVKQITVGDNPRAAFSLEQLRVTSLAITVPNEQ